MNTALTVLVVAASLLGSIAAIVAVRALRHATAAHRQAQENKRRLDSYDEARRILYAEAIGASPPPPERRRRGRGGLWLVPILAVLAGVVGWIKQHPYVVAGTGAAVAIAATTAALLLLPSLTQPPRGRNSPTAQPQPPAPSVTSTTSVAPPVIAVPPPNAPAPTSSVPTTFIPGQGAPVGHPVPALPGPTPTPVSPTRTVPPPPPTTTLPPPTIPPPTPTQPACTLGVRLPPLIDLCVVPLRR